MAGATDLERLVVQLSADITKYDRAMSKALQITQNNTKKIQKNIDSLSSSVGSTFSKLTAPIAGFAAALLTIDGVKAFANLSDAATKITNSLKTTGLAGKDLIDVQNQLFAVANKNGAPIEALAQLYGRVSVVQKELGVSSSQLVQLTDNVGKSLKITGTSAEEASGTLLQLAQAFGGNKIQAQEYNSLIDGALPLLKAAAAGIKEAGGSVATLTKLVKDGKISNKAFFDGIQAGQPVLDKILEGSTETFGQAFENLHTALIKAAGQFNSETGFAAAAAKQLQGIADGLSTLDFTQTVSSINQITAAINTAVTAGESLLQKLADIGKANGVEQYASQQDNSTDGINKLMAANAAASQAALDTGKHLQELDNERLDVAKQIQSILANPDLSGLASIQIVLNNLKGDLRDIDATIANVKQGVADRKDADLSPTAAGPLPARVVNSLPHPNAAAAINPISIADPKYAVVADPKKGGRGSKSDPYKTQLDSITKSTDALNAETAAQAKLNPLVDDYGFAVAKAKEQSLLETAAIQKNGEVTSAQAIEIDKVSTAYANATASAAKLADEQERVRQTQEEIQATAKDVSRGIVDGFVQGESAAKVFSDALSKIGSKLLDLAFDSAFTSSSKGGLGIGDAISKLFGFADGGYTGQGGKNEPAGIVHKGEYVVPKSVVDKLGVGSLEKRLAGYANGGLVGARIASMPQARNSQSGVNLTYAPVIDARGADQAAISKLQMQLDNDRKSFEARTIKTIRTAKNSNVKGI